MVKRRDRDQQGRFKSGWRGGPGNPQVVRLGELQAAVQEAAEPRIVQGVIKRLAKLALEGDVAAAKVLLDRVLGRPRQEQTRAGFELPAIASAADVPAALNDVLQAAASGSISSEDAVRFAGVLDLTRRSIESAEFDARLKRVEEQQGLQPLRLA